MADVLAIIKENSSVFSLPLPPRPAPRRSMSASVRVARRASVRTAYSVHSSHHDSIAPVKRWRAWALLFVFSMAQAIDLFNVTAPTIALPDISSNINISSAERQWVVSAYSLTFGAFMLTGGRISTIYGHKRIFVLGFAAVGICAIINGFAQNGPMLFVFRAFQGVGASLTVPSALAMITYLFPSPGEQDLAIGIFAGFGALGGICGLILGGVISEFLTWRWIFWIISMVILPMSALTYFLAPHPPTTEDKPSIRQLDYLGLVTVTLAFILFIYAVTEGNNQGWTKAGVLAPLVISILLFPVFGYVETKVPAPLIPPVVWTFPGFVSLFLITFSEYMTMNVIIFQQSQVFQDVWGTSAVGASLRIIPFGIAALFMTIGIGYVTPHVAPRWIIVAAETVMACGALLLTFAPTVDHYWTRVVPGLVLAALGCSSGFVASNIAMLRTPLGKPTVVLQESNAVLGSIFNADLQLGSAMGLAIATAITTQINSEHPGPGGSTTSGFAGYRGSFLFIVGLCAFEAVLALVTLRGGGAVPVPAAQDQEKIAGIEKYAIELEAALGQGHGRGSPKGGEKSPRISFEVGVRRSFSGDLPGQVVLSRAKSPPLGEDIDGDIAVVPRSPRSPPTAMRPAPDRRGSFQLRRMSSERYRSITPVSYVTSGGDAGRASPPISLMSGDRESFTRLPERAMTRRSLPPMTVAIDLPVVHSAGDSPSHSPTPWSTAPN